MCDEYNGYPNYQTWNVALWLDNEEGTYLFIRRMAAEAKNESESDDNVKDGTWTKEQAAKYNLAVALKHYVEECNPLAEEFGMFTDLLGHALANVDWDVIAENILQE